MHDKIDIKSICKKIRTCNNFLNPVNAKDYIFSIYIFHLIRRSVALPLGEFENYIIYRTKQET